MTTSWSSTVTPPSLKTARWRTRKRSWWRRSWSKRMPRSRSNSSIRLLHCLADVFCRNLKYALIWFFSKPQDPFVISQYHYVIQLLHICNQQSDMMHEDQAKQKRRHRKKTTYLYIYMKISQSYQRPDAHWTMKIFTPYIYIEEEKKFDITRFP